MQVDLRQFCSQQQQWLGLPAPASPMCSCAFQTYTTNTNPISLLNALFSLKVKVDVPIISSCRRRILQTTSSSAGHQEWTSRTLVVMWVSFWQESRTTAYQDMGHAKKLFPQFSMTSHYSCYSFFVTDLYWHFILPSFCCFLVSVSAIALCEDWMNDRCPTHHSCPLSALCRPLFGLGFQVTSLSQNDRLPKLTPFYCFPEKTMSEHYITLIWNLKFRIL